MSIVWLTGFSGAGKSTIATSLQETLANTRDLAPPPILDGDAVRAALEGKRLHGPEGQQQNLETITNLAKRHLQSNPIVIGAFVSPNRELRTKIRDKIQSDEYRFVEVHVQATIATCEKRDVKGLYERQSRGESIFLAGVNVPYDEPLDPQVICNTDRESIEESTGKIIDYLNRNGLLEQ